MANLCIKTPSSAIQVLIFQLLVLRPRPNITISQVIILTVREYVREDPAENEENANNVQKIGTNLQNAKAPKKSVSWVNILNNIGKD